MGLGNNFWTYKLVLRGLAELLEEISQRVIRVCGRWRRGGAGKIATGGKKKEHPILTGSLRAEFFFPRRPLSPGCLITGGTTRMSKLTFSLARHMVVSNLDGTGLHSKSFG